MRARVIIACLLAAPLVQAAPIPQDVVERLRYLIRAELELQSRAKSGGQCTEDEAFEAAERALVGLERSLAAVQLNKADKFGNLVAFFKDKMINKCCQLSGKTPPQGGGGGGRGRGGGGGGGGRGRGGWQ